MSMMGVPSIRSIPPSVITFLSMEISRATVIPTGFTR